jgi:hypothetical protein
VNARVKADKYISRDGGDPVVLPVPEPTKINAGEATVTIALADYKRLLEAAQLDDAICWCDQCGAWLDCDDPAWHGGDDFRGCLWACTGEDRFKVLCRMHRVAE